MESSLAITLGRFPLFAGRLRVDKTGDYAVDLTNAGASFSVASCDVTLEELLPEGMHPPKSGVEDGQVWDDAPQSPTSTAATATAAGKTAAAFIPDDFSMFIPKVPAFVTGFRDGRMPLMHAQVTRLKNGGTVLGVAIPHLLADQETCRIVLKSWAEEYTICHTADRAGKLGLVKPFASETLITVIEAADAVVAVAGGSKALSVSGKSVLEPYVAHNLHVGWESLRFERRTWQFLPNLVRVGVANNFAAGSPMTVAYHVSAARLAELKAEASNALASGSGNGAAWISTNDALAARIMLAIAQLPGKLGKKELQLVVDLRTRMDPIIPLPALGNYSWTVAVRGISNSSSGGGGGTTLQSEERLGLMASRIRSAILNVLEGECVAEELKWLHDNTKKGATMPCVFKNFADMMRTTGPLMLSHWSWGGADGAYNDLKFGKGEHCAPIWHQPTFAKLPNCIFIVPAAAAAEGGGVVVHITLHQKLAKLLIEKCPEL